MTEVFYFSATGNSLYAASRTAQALEAKLTYIPGCSAKTEADRVVIVTPVYALGLPVPTADLIKELKTTAPVYIIMTYGGAVMGADRAAYDACAAAGLDIRAVHVLKMVESFTVFLSVPKGYIRRTLKKAPARLDRIIESIKAGEAFEPKRKKSSADAEKMREAWRQMGRRLWVSDECTGCGKCAGICPSGNIEIRDGRASFKDACVGCLGCYHRCPKKAVKFGKFKKKFRYYCPLVEQMGEEREKKNA